MSQEQTSPHTLDIAGLETVYDQLATAIDTAGPQRSELFLVKLALLAAERLGSASVFGAGAGGAAGSLVRSRAPGKTAIAVGAPTGRGMAGTG